VYAALLTLVAAAIAGLLPGLKVTRGIGTRLRQSGPGGGGLRFGGIWTVLIVMQVAVMAIVPTPVIAIYVMTSRSFQEYRGAADSAPVLGSAAAKSSRKATNLAAGGRTAHSPAQTLS